MTPDMHSLSDTRPLRGTVRQTPGPSAARCPSDARLHRSPRHGRGSGAAHRTCRHHHGRRHHRHPVPRPRRPSRRSRRPHRRPAPPGLQGADRTATPNRRPRLGPSAPGAPPPLTGHPHDPGRKLLRVDTGPLQHVDSPALVVPGQRREQIEPAGPRVAPQFRPLQGPRHRRGGRGRPAFHARVPHNGIRAPDDRNSSGVLHRTLPAEPVADTALDEIPEDLGQLGSPSKAARTSGSDSMRECSRCAVSTCRSPSRSARLRAPVTTAASSTVSLASNSARFGAGC